jgi:penicillin-binding protein 1C
MVYTNVCLKSGFLASDICEVTDSVLIPISGIHSSPCPYHQLIHLDATERYRVNSSCESVNTMKHQSWFILPPSMEWYYKNRDHIYQTLPPYKTGCNQAPKNAVMEMIYPKQSSAIYVPIELNGETSKTVFEVAHRNKQTTIYWHLDDEFIGTTKEFHQMGLHPSIGKHTLILIDEHGDRLEQHFDIIK